MSLGNHFWNLPLHALIEFDGLVGLVALLQEVLDFCAHLVRCVYGFQLIGLCLDFFTKLKPLYLWFTEDGLLLRVQQVSNDRWARLVSHGLVQFEFKLNVIAHVKVRMRRESNVGGIIHQLSQGKHLASILFQSEIRRKFNDLLWNRGLLLTSDLSRRSTTCLRVCVALLRTCHAHSFRSVFSLDKVVII